MGRSISKIAKEQSNKFVSDQPLLSRPFSDFLLLLSALFSQTVLSSEP